MAAQDANAKIADVRSGVSPFVAWIDLDGPQVADVEEVEFRIAPRPGSISKPVHVTYDIKYLQRRGLSPSPDKLSVPVFGLYADYANNIELTLHMNDGEDEALTTSFTSARYSDPNGVYDRPTVVKPRTGQDAIAFDFVYLKSSVGSPVIVDTDGQIRWVVPGLPSAASSIFEDGGFFVGSGDSLLWRRVELDGQVQNQFLAASDVTNFHHDVAHGKQGLLVQMDGQENGVAIVESILLEIDPDSGAILQRWDLGDSFSRHMQAHGDDPSLFVRPGVDWFHMNSALYDARDDSLIVSSRENFVVKIDYATGNLKWLLGDPSKYWFSFASLAALNLGLASPGFYPVGQHALSLTPEGNLLLFNNGQGSLNQPAGAPAGTSRTFSAVSEYAIDEAALQATEVSHFDHDQSIFSPFCSSVTRTGAQDAMLVTYSVADNASRLYLSGVDAQGHVAFELAYPTTGCNTAWNAQPIALDSLRLQ